MTAIREVLERVHTDYPQRLREHEGLDRPRFHIELVVDRLGRVPHAVCDIGGGLGPVSVGFAALGARSVLLDALDDPINWELGDDALEVHRQHGVEIVSADALEFDLTTIGPFDAVTTFDSMEHWHNSPKRMLHSAVAALEPGGVFVLGVPNAANLRKRVMTPLGRVAWSPIEEWYELDLFRGHVREPTVSDLRYLARDLRLAQVEILGRNWMGHRSYPRLTRLVDHALRLRPSLCSDIYLVGRKPG